MSRPGGMGLYIDLPAIRAGQGKTHAYSTLCASAGESATACVAHLYDVEPRETNLGVLQTPIRDDELASGAATSQRREATPRRPSFYPSIPSPLSGVESPELELDVHSWSGARKHRCYGRLQTRIERNAMMIHTVPS
ncbi:hypothetical protein PYCCODRAFT_1435950 [Trametes coccinea BRFM310]|uniref:Uncharacterized protein n=1 Tax=Trametes coccinea (strain BRFM310) TaxID=1353009 RepID=A0A1Y2ILE0_TRAC3|nr:hypothetical protein PYCCODRAFT_1435950 [Trametes coccinea BRFM310]